MHFEMHMIQEIINKMLNTGLVCVEHFIMVMPDEHQTKSQYSLGHPFVRTFQILFHQPAHSQM